MARHGRAVIPFGKWKGCQLRLIPDDYLSWLTTAPMIWEPQWSWLRESLIAELKFRGMRYDLAHTLNTMRRFEFPVFPAIRPAEQNPSPGCVPEIEDALDVVAKENLRPVRLLCTAAAMGEIQSTVFLGMNSYLLFCTEAPREGLTMQYRDKRSGCAVPVSVSPEVSCGFVIDANDSGKLPTMHIELPIEQPRALPEVQPLGGRRIILEP
jgi:uncharacterized protein (DUF3820 family)